MEGPSDVAVSSGGAAVDVLGGWVVPGGMMLKVTEAPHSEREASFGQQPASVQYVPSGQYARVAS